MIGAHLFLYCVIQGGPKKYATIKLKKNQPNRIKACKKDYISSSNKSIIQAL